MSNLEDRLDREVVRIPVRAHSIDVAVRQGKKPDEPQPDAPDVPGTPDASDEAQTNQPEEKKKLQFSRKKLISIIIFATLLVILAIWFIPYTRNLIVNMLGMRTSLTVITRELQSSGAVVTIKNTSVKINGTIKTADGNEITFKDLPYGSQEVEVTKNGYAVYTQQVTLDYDPFFNLFSWYGETILITELKLTGTTISFTAKGWTSGKPLQAGEFTVGDRTARPDKQGNVTLIAPPQGTQKIMVSAHFDSDYLDKTFEIDPKQKNQEVTFIPSGRHYFTQKEGGLLKVYSSYADTSDKKLCVQGTPNDTDIQFAVRSDGNYAAMVSTREGEKDENATKLQKLYWVNLSDCTIEAQDTGYFMTLQDWLGDSIVYTAAYRDPKATDFTWRLKTLDTNTKNLYELSMSKGYITNVTCKLDTVIFTKGEPAGQPDSAKNTTLHTVNKLGGEKREIASNVKDFRQIDKMRVAFSTADGLWSEINVNTGQIQASSAPNSAPRFYLSTESRRGERIFIENVSNGRSLVVETLDERAKGPFVSDPGLRGPIRFLSSYVIVYRKGNADYVVSTMGGEPKKVADVVPAAPPAAGQFPYN
jgi:hypothetical protein